MQWSNMSKWQVMLAGPPGINRKAIWLFSLLQIFLLSIGMAIAIRNILGSHASLVIFIVAYTVPPLLIGLKVDSHLYRHGCTVAAIGTILGFFGMLIFGALAIPPHSPTEAGGYGQSVGLGAAIMTICALIGIPITGLFSLIGGMIRKKYIDN